MVRVPSDRFPEASTPPFSEWGQVIGDPRKAKGATARARDSAHPLESGVCDGQVEELRVEHASPLDVVGVLFAVGVAEGLDQVLIAAGAPAVLGWARSLTIDTDGELQDRRTGSIDSTTTSWRHESPRSYS
jgi:hypothetical protein